MKKSAIFILIFSLIGTLFAGYLTFTKLFSGTCSLTEGCTYLFGYPTCVYGFVLFFTIFLLTLSSLKSEVMLKAVFWVSLAGVLFSGYFTYVDILQWTGHYSLGLPSCIYGLVMFVIIFILSIFAKK